MPVKCQFNLSRASAVYYTGEQVSGTLTLTIIKKPLQVEGISITLLGNSTTSWNETNNCLQQIEHDDSTGPTEPAQIHYSASKIHVQQTLQLAESMILPLGSVELDNFEFQIPSNVPGSCNLDYGSINYSLQLTLERRSKHAKRFQQRVCIRNRIELLELRPATTESATLCLSLPRTVFVPGQRVAYQLEASSPSSQLMTRLCQSVSYESQKPLAKHKEVIRVLDESCDMADSLHLPLTLPIMSRMPGEPIKIFYYLETLSSCSDPLRLPLIVGTVAPPVNISTSTSSLGLVNFGLSESDLMFPSTNQLQPHSCSREFVTSIIAKHNEHLHLIRRQKKHSYVRLALRYFYKRLLPAK